MPVISRYRPGQFCWTDLATPDLEDAKRFYSSLLGWTMQPAPGGHNALAARDGKAVAALVELKQAPPRWAPYVAADNAAEVAARAERLGGKIVQPAFDVLDLGRIAVIADPTGAWLAVWQAIKHAGAELLREPGAMAWNELYCKDPARAAVFYGELFGWRARGEALSTGQQYTYFEDPVTNEPIAGMMSIDASWEPMNPWWAVYFQVEDCDQAVESLQHLGGTVGKAPFDVRGVGRIAMVSDRQNAAFALFTPKK